MGAAALASGLVGIVVGLLIAYSGDVRLAALASPLSYVDSVLATLRGVAIVAAAFIVYEVFTYKLSSGVAGFWLAAGLGARRMILAALFVGQLYALALAVGEAVALPPGGAGLAALGQLLGDASLAASVAVVASLYTSRLYALVALVVAVVGLTREVLPMLVGGLKLPGSLAVMLVFAPWRYYWVLSVGDFKGSPSVPAVLSSSLAFVAASIVLGYVLALRRAGRVVVLA